MTYDKSRPYNTITSPDLDPESTYDVRTAYGGMGAEGRVFMACQKLAREQQRLTAIMVALLKKNADLEASGKELDREDKLRRTAASSTLDKLKDVRQAEAVFQACLHTRLTGPAPVRLSESTRRLKPAPSAEALRTAMAAFVAFGRSPLVLETPSVVVPQGMAAGVSSPQFPYGQSGLPTTPSTHKTPGAIRIDTWAAESVTGAPSSAQASFGRFNPLLPCPNHKAPGATFVNSWAGESIASTTHAPKAPSA